MAHYDRNLVTDYSAPTNGVSAADTAIEAWVDFLLTLTAGDTATLTIPNAGAGGSNTYVFNGGGDHRCSMSAGILGGIGVTIECDGVAFTGSFGLAYWIATRDDNLHSSRIETVSSGASTVRLRTTSEHSRYTVGQWVIVGGKDPQGFGSPANMLQIEHRKISAINTGTGDITFTEALNKSYDQDWPLFNGGSSEVVPDATDCGGPATIIALDHTYDLTLTVNGAGSSFDTGQQIYCKARVCTLNGDAGNKLSFLSDGLVPTVSVSTTLTNCVNGEAEIEFDKMFGSVTSTNTEWSRVKLQTAVGDVRLNGDTVTNDVQLARRTRLTDCIIGSLYTGPVSFGWAEECRLIRTTVNGGLNRPQLTDAIADWEWQGSGVLRTTPTGSAKNTARRLAIPGGWFTFGGSRNYGVPFQVTDAWQDPPNSRSGYLYVQTTLSEYPTFDMGSSGFSQPSQFMTIPCLRVYAQNVDSSNLDIMALNHAPQGRPFYEYNERTISGAHNGASPYEVIVKGQFVKIIVDVTQAYTGAQATCRLLLDRFGVFMVDDTHTVIRPSGYYVDLKTVGTRTITPAGVTGAEAGDNLDALDGWVMSGFSPMVNANTTGDTLGQQAIARFQFYCNQGVPTRSFSWNIVPA